MLEHTCPQAVHIIYIRRHVVNIPGPCLVHKLAFAHMPLINQGSILISASDRVSLAPFPVAASSCPPVALQGHFYGYRLNILEAGAHHEQLSRHCPVFSSGGGNEHRPPGTAARAREARERQRLPRGVGSGGPSLAAGAVGGSRSSAW